VKSTFFKNFLLEKLMPKTFGAIAVGAHFFLLHSCEAKIAIQTETGPRSAVCRTSQATDSHFCQPATNLSWTQSSPTAGLNAEATWKPSVNTKLARQKINIYSDESCTGATLSESEISSPSTSQFAYTAKQGGQLRYRIISFSSDNFQNTSECSAPLTVSEVTSAAPSNSSPVTSNSSNSSTAPTAILSSNETNPTRNSAISVTVTISAATTNFTASDLTLGNASVTGFTGSGTSYSFTLIPAGQGAVTVDIAAGTFTDASGTANTAAAQLSRTYDTLPPTIPSIPSCTGSENGTSISWTTGSGDTAGFLVVRKYGSSPTWTPTDGTTYSNATTNNLDDYTHWHVYAGSSTSTTESDVFPGMPHYYAIYAYDALYNYQAALTTNCTPKPMAMLENLPSASFTGSSIDVKVGGQAVTEYQYSLTSPNYYCDETSYSGWTSIATHITDTITRGHYRLCVKGRTAGADAQTTATEYYFFKPSHTSIDWPSRWGSKVQKGDNFRVRWEDHNASDNASGTLSFYYAAATAADCTGATAIATGVSQNTSNKYQNWDTTSIATGTYYICVESYDGTSTISYWAEGSVTIENYCTGTTLTNTLVSGNNGAGTSGDPYNICTLTQLEEMRTMTKTSKYYQLRRDIDASSTSTWNSGAGWTAGTSYNFAQFDGNGYAIRGLTFNTPSSSSYQGFFGTLSLSTTIVIGVRLEDVSMVGGTVNTGGIAGRSYAQISKSYVSGSVSSSSSLGGAVGFMESTGTITTTKIAAQLSTSGSNFGGLVGNNVGSISKVWVTSSMSETGSSKTSIAGIAAINSGNINITSAIFSGTITLASTGMWVGGICGFINSGYTIVLSRNIFAGTMTGTITTSGGIVARSDSLISILGSVNSGTINTGSGSSSSGISGEYGGTKKRLVGNVFVGTLTSTGSEIGGIMLIGSSAQSHLLMSYSAGTVSGGSTVGGIATGRNFDVGPVLIRASYSSSTVSCTGDTCGGGIGYALGNNVGVIDSYATGQVNLNTGTNNVGGAGFIYSVGQSTTAFVKRSYATGTVLNNSAQNKNGGGFVYTTSANGAVYDSFTTSTVTTTNAGGFAYLHLAGSGALSNVYWYKPGGNTLNCVYIDQVTGTTSCTSSNNLTHFQNSSNAPLSSWDFSNIWRIPSGGGFPKLRWQND
jgi:hypothetical protein